MPRRLKISYKHETALNLVEKTSDDIGVTVGKTVFEAATGTAAKRFHVLGGVVVIASIPYDLYAVVKHSISVHKNKPHKMSGFIREHAQEMRDGYKQMEREILIKMFNCWIRNALNKM